MSHQRQYLLHPLPSPNGRNNPNHFDSDVQTFWNAHNERFPRRLLPEDQLEAMPYAAIFSPWNAGTIVTEGLATIIIRDGFEAFDYAVSEDKQQQARNREGCLAFWVDGSAPSNSGSPCVHSGGAVVTRKKSNLEEWELVGTAVVAERLEPKHADLYGFWFALDEFLNRCDSIMEHEAELPWHTFQIFSDGPGTLRDLGRWGTPKSRKGKSEAYCQLADEIVKLLTHIKPLGVRVQLHRVPGHYDVPGNMLADFHAREATRSADILTGLRDE